MYRMRVNPYLIECTPEEMDNLRKRLAQVQDAFAPARQRVAAVRCARTRGSLRGARCQAAGALECRATQALGTAAVIACLDVVRGEFYDGSAVEASGSPQFSRIAARAAFRSRSASAQSLPRGVSGSCTKISSG